MTLPVWAQTIQCVSDFVLPQVITVLLVEDELLLRMDIADQLLNLGFRVLEAGTAAEAVALLAADDDVQIMFTDVDMLGGMDGLMLAAAVRAKWPPVRIIVTSGHRNVALRDLPADSRFFPKPYSGLDVAAAMREMIAA